MVDDNALLVLRKRYLIKDNKGTPVEIPDEMFHGVGPKDDIAASTMRVASGPLSFIKSLMWN